jgi:selenocysteine-specific elongation factor
MAETLKLAAGDLARLREVLATLEREGQVVKIASDLYFAREPFEAARDKLLNYLATHGEITAATYRDQLSASRKYAIALLDYFDHTGLTTRVGDLRRLRRH